MPLIQNRLPMKRRMYKFFLGVLAGLVLPNLLFSQGSVTATITVPVFRKDTLNIVKLGAIGDGSILNTQYINTAINDLSKRGGGVILVPAGLWLTGPIELKSNINLHISQGGTLLFTNDLSQYQLVATNWEGLPQMRNQSPLSAKNEMNIAITGKGIIDGNGDVWRMVKKDKLNETQWKKKIASGGVLSDDKKTWYPSESSRLGATMTNPGVINESKDQAFYLSVKDFLRPNLLVLENCSNILLEGVIFQNSPAWCLHPLLCTNLTVQNITVKNPWYAQNGDGIDVESCKNVLIEKSVFDVGDDALCMKSGRDEAGRKRGIPTENVIIKDCIVYAAHGGFVIGSEMSGGVRNIRVSNCQFIGTDIGLRFKTARGRGGVVENIEIDHIYMKDIVGEAILFDMYYMAKDPIPLSGEVRELPQIELRPFNETTPVFKNFRISHVYCNGAEKAIFIRGVPESNVQYIQLEDMVLQSKRGIEIQEAHSILLKNIQLAAAESDPLIDIVQSSKIIVDRISYAKPAKLLCRVAGERSNAILIRNSAINRSLQVSRTELGALDNAITIE